MSKIKVHSLTGRITARLMRQAFQAVKRNRGAAGVDRVSIKMFAANLEDNLTALMREMKDGSFRPLPLRRVYIDKGPGTTKKRPLGIPVVRDRVRKRWFVGLLLRFSSLGFTSIPMGLFPDAIVTKRWRGSCNVIARGTAWC